MLPQLPSVPAFHRRLATRVEPLALFEALYGNEPLAFLYESLEAHGQRGRYSFIGARPRAVFRAKRDELELDIDGQTQRARGDALEALRGLIRPQTDAPPVAPFCGGAVGYLGYDIVRQIERLPSLKPDDLNVPDAWFLVPREVICFDHLEKLIHVILYQDGGHESRVGEIKRVCAQLDASAAAAAAGATQNPLEAPENSPERMRSTQAAQCVQSAPSMQPTQALPPAQANMTREQFERMVERAKEYIRAGDIFQVVLSQRFEFEVSALPLALYKALRITNPSPYMYYLRLQDLHIAGSSPEVLVGVTGRRVITRPLAGTRPRGATPEEDLALARDLQADPKERAEHVMLVDLGRNDLGRVCERGSVRISDVMQIEHHSRVMHLVSAVEGWLREGCDAMDVFRAAFPAGTVSGAPKVRAMEIIEELEPNQRGIYAGAIGYFSYLGDMDLCIAIRTMVLHGRRGFIQAGAGIVADSDAGREYQETINKASALLRALELSASH